MFRSLRTRLTSTFMIAATLLVGAGTVALERLITRATWGPLDAELLEEAETVADAIRNDDSPAMTVLERIAGERDAGGRKFAVVFAPDGSVLARAGAMPPHTAPASAADPPYVFGVGDDVDRYRIASNPVAGGKRVEVGLAVHARAAALQRVRLALATGAAAALALLGMLCWGITSRATREMERLAQELENVEAGSLGRRLIERRTSEVDRVVKVLNRVLERLDRAVGHLQRFTADASHELRTPIAALQARLEVTLAREPSLDVYRDAVCDALEQTDRLRRLAESLLTLSRLDAGPSAVLLEDVDLGTIAREVEESLEPLAEDQGRRFEAEIAAGLHVRGEPALLKRLLVNLLDNAFRHTPATADVSLRVRREDDTAVVEVRDAGGGVDPETLPELFERFRRGATRTAGSGLGLALCREIVACHDGGIAIESTAAAGTRVTVRLPAAAAGP
ncbi:MAG: two-component system, OmpR family, sensor kinase [Candidatus Binatota bacterium]|jgi:signal transduction histidine kinase|nr:two-component system, OmpR family, sensor kinase [Candidatus Binatota bacterium]